VFRELSSEDPQEYRKHMRMSAEKFNQLLRLVEFCISKTDTVMKAAILQD
jgi:hydrogenase maturation factor